jgi:hypothetical protein
MEAVLVPPGGKAMTTLVEGAFWVAAGRERQGERNADQVAP